MQKKIIALAVAGLVSGVAYAQTNVTIYGIADAAYTYSSIGDTKFSGIQSGGRNGSRVGFRGEEALGNGLKAVFQYEFGTSLDSNSGINSTRIAFVGLSGGFGSLTFGRQASPSYLYLGRTNANDVTSVHPTNLALDNAWTFSTLSTGGTGRWDNSIAYSSPKWSGFDLRAIYSFGEQVRDSYSDASTNASKIGLGVSYTNGPLYLTAMYQGVLDNDGTTPAGVQLNADGSNGWAVGGSYDFKFVKVYANFIQESFDEDTDAFGRDKHTLWSVSAGVPVSKAGTVNFEYMQFKANERQDNKAKGYSIGYEHKLSPRTIIYTAVSRISNDDDLGWSHSTTRNGTLSQEMGENSTNFQLGIRHAF